MDAKDIAMYGGLAYLIYRLTRPAEASAPGGPGGPEYVPALSPVGPSGPEYVPVPSQPALASRPTPVLQLPVPTSPPVYPVAPPVSGFPTVLVDTNVGTIRVPANYTAYDLYALGYNRPLEEGRQPTQIQYAVT